MPFSRNGGPRVGAAEILHGLADAYRSIPELDAAFDLQVGERQMRPQHELAARGLSVVRDRRRFTVHGHARRSFFRRRTAEDIEAEVVSQDAREQPRIHAGAVDLTPILRTVVSGRFNRRPWGRPQRVDAALFVEDLGEVAAFVDDGDAQLIVLDGRRATTSIAGRPGHAPVLCTVAGAVMRRETLGASAARDGFLHHRDSRISPRETGMETGMLLMSRGWGLYRPAV
jgi:hypothetical protein